MEVDMLEDQLARARRDNAALQHRLRTAMAAVAAAGTPSASVLGRIAAAFPPGEGRGPEGTPHDIALARARAAAAVASEQPAKRNKVMQLPDTSGTHLKSSVRSRFAAEAEVRVADDRGAVEEEGEEKGCGSFVSEEAEDEHVLHAGAVESHAAGECGAWEHPRSPQQQQQEDDDAEMEEAQPAPLQKIDANPVQAAQNDWAQEEPCTMETTAAEAVQPEVYSEVVEPTAPPAVLPEAQPQPEVLSEAAPPVKRKGRKGKKAKRDAAGARDSGPADMQPEQPALKRQTRSSGALEEALKEQAEAGQEKTAAVAPLASMHEDQTIDFAVMSAEAGSPPMALDDDVCDFGGGDAVEQAGQGTQDGVAAPAFAPAPPDPEPEAAPQPPAGKRRRKLLPAIGAPGSVLRAALGDLDNEGSPQSAAKGVVAASRGGPTRRLAPGLEGMRRITRKTKL
jgi:hypothetical protein